MDRLEVLKFRKYNETNNWFFYDWNRHLINRWSNQIYKRWCTIPGSGFNTNRNER